MSYEIVKGIKFKDNQVWIKSDSNNVSPRHYTWWHCTSLTKILQEKGREAVDKEILYEYFNGNFAQSNNNYHKSLVLLDRDEYNYNTVGIDIITKEQKKHTENDVKNLLYHNYIKFKNREFADHVIHSTKHDAYIYKFSRNKWYMIRDINAAKVFRSKEDAMWKLPMKDGYTVVKINKGVCKIKKEK